MRSMDSDLERHEKLRDSDMAEIRERMRELVSIARFRPVEAAVYSISMILATGLVGILVVKVWGGN